MFTDFIRVNPFNPCHPCSQLFLLLLPTFLAAQPGYFRFPLQPGQRAYLSGSFAELRPNHFHAGIDVKTGGREGLPVQAAAAGYVARILVTAGGYGNAVFVRHPNGYVTVYAHLQRFSERIGAYVRERQYRAEAFEADLQPSPKDLPVTAGELLGLSGNSGGSAGPHLHFEVRNEAGLLTDPQSLRFPEIEDTTPPVIEALALRPLGIASRLNGAFDRQEWLLDGQTILPDTLTATGDLGLELLAYDRANGTPNQNGLSCVEVHVDGVETYFHCLETLPNAFTRDLNVHTDYATARLTGLRFQRCYVADGNDRLPIYKPTPSRGRLRIAPGVHRVEVTVWDSFQNKTAVTFWVQHEPDRPVPDSLTTSDGLAAALLPPSLSWSVEENTLVVKASNPRSAASATLRLPDGKTETLVPAYRRAAQAVYLYDLRRGLPDSVAVDGAGVRLPFRKMLLPGRPEVVVGPGWRFEAGPRALYDTLYLTAQSTATGGVQFGPVGVPFREAVTIRLTTTLPDSARTYAVASASDGFTERSAGGDWRGDTLTFSAYELGLFSVKTDTVAPTIRLLRKNEREVLFRIADDWSGVRAFRATVDSQWVLMNYDYKTGLLWSEKQDSTVAFRGPLRLSVTDNSGNTAIFSGDFSVPFPAPKSPRPRTPPKRKKR
jgi:hypothetical protein